MIEYEIPQPIAEQSSNVLASLPPPENKRFYPALNGLRAVAVLLVFFQHYVTRDGVLTGLSWGWTGVSVFFVLSGFLITGILFDSQHAPHRFRNFYARRALRIFPVYYAILLLAVVLYPIFRWKLYAGTALIPLYLENFTRYLWLDKWHHAGGALDHLVSTRPFFGAHLLVMGHFWSLCVEEQFYLVWPAVVFLVKDRIKLRNLCLAGIVFTLGLRILAIAVVPRPYLDADLLYRCTPFCMDALLLGGLLALMQRGPERAIMERLSGPCLKFTLVFLAIGLVGYLAAIHHLPRPSLHGPLLSTIGFSCIDFFSALIMIRAILPETATYRFLCIWPLAALGEMSYGFYLFHDLFHQEYFDFVTRHLHLHARAEVSVSILLALLCTLLLSYLSFRFFELPILRLKSHFVS